MVFLQAAARKSSVAGACLEMAEQGHVRLCLSSPILAEIHDVLLRPEIRTRFPSLTETLVNEFLASVCRIGSVYPEVGHHFAYPRDPKDEPYLNLAIEARARYLASRDNDILDLRSSLAPEAVDFRQRFPEIRILEPIEFLREMRLELLPAPPAPRPREPGLER
jgi:putative PIN family toxin of toxin-antitoxin system